MATIQIPEHHTPPAPPQSPPPGSYPGGRSARTWRWTAGSGIALVGLATMHIVAQHFVAQGAGGLRNYHQVIEYIGNPVILVLECAFVLALAIHAMLGLRSVLYDLSPGERARRRIDACLWTLGTVTVLYAFALVITLAARA